MKKQMKVLHFGAELLKSTGGTSKAVSDFQNAIPGSDVYALCDPKKLLAEEFYNLSWSYIKASSSPIGKLFLRPRYSEIKHFFDSSFDVDVLFSHMLYRYNSNLVANISRFHGVPYYVVPHGSLDPWVFSYGTWKKKAWLKYFGYSFLQNAKAVIFATQRELEKAQETVNLTNGVVMHWPIALPPKVELSMTSLRVKYGLPLDMRLLISYGRLHSMKRPIDLINIFNALPCSKVGLVLFGPDDDITLKYCQSLANKRTNKVVFCFPPQYGDSLRELIHACDAYISWSRRENFNYCLGESLGSGLPAILSCGNDLGTDLKSTGCVWSLADDSDETLLSAIHDFANTSSNRLLEMSESARTFAGHYLSCDTFQAKLSMLIN